MRINQTIIKQATQKHLKIALAESCTGGMVASKLTDIAGASQVLTMSLVVYANEAKQNLLGISDDILQNDGAVSSKCAHYMLLGLQGYEIADILCAITGVAGPGHSDAKPAGLVFIGIKFREYCQIHQFNFQGTRNQVRQQSCQKALELILQLIENTEY